MIRTMEITLSATTPTAEGPSGHGADNDDDLRDLAGLPAEVALPRLLEAHGGRLYHLALRFCGNPEDAEDLVQDVFLQAYRKWDQFQGDSRPTTWLFTIASRTCQRRQRLRSGQPRHMIPLEELLPSPKGPVVDLPSPGKSPLDERLQREAQESVGQAIAELPHHYRMALVLKDIVELSVAEVASILGIKPATVKTRVHRARLQLRQALQQRLPTKNAPPPIYSQRVCLDLLRAKQEALDRGVPFPVPQEEVCERCEALFSSLELAHDACGLIGQGELPSTLADRLRQEMAAGG